METLILAKLGGQEVYYTV